MKTQTIRYGSEYMFLHEDGCISRPAINMGPSGQWRIVGAVTLNNFGHTVRRYSLADIQSGAEIQWRHGNGKQKTFVIDFDHGTRRVWTCSHHVDRLQIERKNSYQVVA